MSQERVSAVASTVRSKGWWLGELTRDEIEGLRQLGLTVRVMGRSPNGSTWDCEVTR
jgi:hypothetical protein